MSQIVDNIIEEIQYLFSEEEQIEFLNKLVQLNNWPCCKKGDGMCPYCGLPHEC